jgi:uncharacterized linocin/CFP29 family protein
MIENQKTIGVVTVQSNYLIMFNGDIFFGSSEAKDEKYLKAKHIENIKERKILLVRPNKL